MTTTSCEVKNEIEMSVQNVKLESKSTRQKRVVSIPSTDVRRSRVSVLLLYTSPAH